MATPIKLIKYAAIAFIALSIVSITGYVAQQIGDQTESDLKTHIIDKDRLISDLTTQLLKAHENKVSYQEVELGTFLESLDLKSKKNSIVSLQKEIDSLGLRVTKEKRYLEAISIFLIITASLIFFAVIVIVEKRNRSKSEWIHSLAHQLQNSVAPIVLGISNLKLNLPKNDREESLDILYEDTERLESLTTRMLQLFTYKQERSKNTKKEDVNLELLIKKIINNSKLLPNKKNLRLSCTSKTEKPLIRGDKALIEQLFVNLIHNAMGFSHPEDKVSIEISNAGKAIVIKVIDQGIGIKDKSSVLKNTIIRPTTKIDQKIGHGLGLKLAQRITTLHNGKFDINNNKDGKGVTATVKFPL